MHVSETSTFPLSVQQIFTVMVDNILIHTKLHKREKYSKEAQKRIVIGGYHYLLYTVSVFLGQ